LLWNSLMSDIPHVFVFNHLSLCLMYLYRLYNKMGNYKKKLSPPPPNFSLSHVSVANLACLIVLYLISLTTYIGPHGLLQGELLREGAVGKQVTFPPTCLPLVQCVLLLCTYEWLIDSRTRSVAYNANE
jgi:hypothetical protein